ncbi:MAG: hypothetical protein LBF75_08180 [Treponema sp.]|jgi:hypothetical protein|nr:hypothetical protein [Treponema sp.]
MEKRDKKDIRREEGLYPIREDQFREVVLPIREASYPGKGGLSAVSHDNAFCSIPYMLRIGCPWCD